eukprot:312134-Prymnesium_polylepis.1
MSTHRYVSVRHAVDQNRLNVAVNHEGEGIGQQVGNVRAVDGHVGELQAGEADHVCNVREAADELVGHAVGVGTAHAHWQSVAKPLVTALEGSGANGAMCDHRDIHQVEVRDVAAMRSIVISTCQTRSSCLRATARPQVQERAGGERVGDLQVEEVD